MNKQQDKPIEITRRAIDKMGRITLPAAFRKELCFELGDEITLELHKGVMIIRQKNES